MGGNNARALAREFKISRQLNLEADRVVYHASLSLPENEPLDEPTWNELANRYLEEMGFDSNQYVVYRHSNTEHDHIHICASRIRLDNGKIVHDSWDYKRSETIIRQLELDYNLQATKGSHEKLSRNPSIGQQKRLEREHEEYINGERLILQERPIKQQLQELIDRATIDKLTMPQLVERLQLQGVEVRHGLTRNGKSKGISYSWNDQKFSGTSLGPAYTFPGLQKHKGIDYQPIRDDEHIEHLLKNPKEQAVESQRFINTIADFIEQSVVDDALAETLPQLIEQLSRYRQQLANNKTTFDDLETAIVDEEQQLSSPKAVDAISNFIEQSVVDDALVETLPQLTEQLSAYQQQQLEAGKTAFDDLGAAIVNEEQRLSSQRAVDAISNFIEQSVVDDALAETLPQLTEQLSIYRQQLFRAKTAFNDFETVLTTELQSHFLVQPLQRQGLAYIDQQAQVVFIKRDLNGEKSGALVWDTHRQDNRAFKYPESDRSHGWFHLKLGGEADDKIERVFLCDSPIDALTMAEIDRNEHKGQPPVRTMYMAVDDPNNLPVEFLKNISRIGAAFNNDDQGNEAAQVVQEILPQAKRIAPSGLTWNEILIEQQQEIREQNQRGRGLSR